jgi:sec-independent protein translocase protein TatA
MFGLPGGTEWILLVLIVLLLFGSARLPRLARSMREAKDEFKKANADSKATSDSKVPEAHTENPEPAPSEDGTT